MKNLLLAAILFCGTMSVCAQKILTVDTEGNPVAYAHVFGEDEKIIGTTGMDGTLDGFKGDQTLTITHVAFKTKKVYVKGLGDVRITLEDSDYGLDEIVVKPKGYIYVQTYYRMIYMRDDTMTYCRFGVVDNVYDVKKKSVSSSCEHLSKAEMGILKTIIDGIGGRIVDAMGAVPNKNVRSGFDNPNSKLKMKSEPDGRKSICYGDQVVGYVVNDMKDHVRRVSVDEALYDNLRSQEKTDAKAEKLQKKGKTPKDKTEKEMKKNVQENCYRVYQLDDEGQCGVTDFVMSQWHDDYDRFDRVFKKDVHIRIWLESYTTDREYVTKEELKEKKKANKVNLTHQFVQEFERQHNIPALPAKAQEGIKKLFSK